MLKKVLTLLLIVLMMLALSACGDSNVPSSQEPAEVMTLAPVGQTNLTPIATLNEEQSTQAAPTPDETNASRDFVCALTDADAEGPYFIEGAPIRENIAPEGAEGQPLVVTGTVYLMTTTGCQPLEGAVIDIWQTDANGEYDFSEDFLYRGKVESDEDGNYGFDTIYPGNYEPRPRHIHIRITHPDAASLTTQLYFEGDPLLNGATSNDSTRILRLTEEDGGFLGTFNIVLSAK